MQSIKLTLFNHPTYNRQISKEACSLCGLLADMLPEDEESPDLPVDIDSTEIMDKVLEFLEHHSKDPCAKIETPIITNKLAEIVSPFDTKFANMAFDQGNLFKIMLAANYLSCDSLLRLCLCKIATMIKDKEPDEVRAMFNIPEPTREEEQRVRDANQWIFDIKQ